MIGNAARWLCGMALALAIAGCLPHQNVIMFGNAEGVSINYLGDVSATMALARRHCAQFEREPVLRERGFGLGQMLFDARQLFLGGAKTFFGLRNLRERLGILRRDFGQPFFVELNPTFVSVNLAFQFQTALLLRGDFVFQI